MADSIDETLKEIIPRIRAELNKLGYSAHVPESDDLLQETIIRLWKALENRDGKLEFINSYVKKVVLSVYINEVNRIRKENQVIFSSGGQRRNEYEAAGGRLDFSAPLRRLSWRPFRRCRRGADSAAQNFRWVLPLKWPFGYSRTAQPSRPS